ncbi:MAG: hypothetical protein ACK41D_06245 [Rubricoccaceae bacterium]
MTALSQRIRDRARPCATSVLLLPACACFALVDVHAPGVLGMPWQLAHAFNLVVHEAGHAFFGFFGRGPGGTP